MVEKSVLSHGPMAALPSMGVFDLIVPKPGALPNTFIRIRIGAIAQMNVQLQFTKTKSQRWGLRASPKDINLHRSTCDIRTLKYFLLLKYITIFA